MLTGVKQGEIRKGEINKVEQGVKKDVEGLNTKNCRGVKNSNLMLVAAVHKWRLNKISVAAEADIVIVFQVLAYSKPVWLVPLVDFSLSRDKMSSKKFF